MLLSNTEILELSHNFQTEFLKSVVECALLAVVLEHREANASVMKFFYDLFRAGRTRDQDLDFEVRVGY